MRALVISVRPRDTHTLREMGFQVRSCTISAKGTIKDPLGSVNLALVCRGQLVNLGDVWSPMTMAWSSCVVANWRELLKPAERVPI